MPAVSRKQQKWAFVQAEKRAKGERGDTNMSLDQIKEFEHLAKGKKAKK
jgi:hypothetical protein